MIIARIDASGRHDRTEATHGGLDDRVPAIVAGGDIPFALVDEARSMNHSRREIHRFPTRGVQVPANDVFC